MVMKELCVKVDIHQTKPNRPAEEVEATFGIKAQSIGNVFNNSNERQVRSPDGFE